MITVYVDGYFVNQYDASVVIALEEKGVPYATSRALLRDGGGVPAALASRTRIARVPAMQDGELWLTESSAIVEYLEERFPPPDHPAVLPEDASGRARARQLMAFVRSELGDLRSERPWWMCVYPAPAPAPLSPAAERSARELCGVVEQFAAAGELAGWNISHADLALTLLRLGRTGYPLPELARRLVDDNVARPSVRAYLEHSRPPNPPPHALAAG